MINQLFLSLGGNLGNTREIFEGAYPLIEKKIGKKVQTGGLKINCTAVKIDLSPVQASIFNIPTSGYRVLN